MDINGDYKKKKKTRHSPERSVKKFIEKLTG